MRALNAQEMMFNVQCMMGHVHEAPPGSELEKRCIKRAELGFLDAYPVHPSECWKCKEELRAEQAKDALLYDDFDLALSLDWSR